jgi:retron-type reverse transcriptase
VKAALRDGGSDPITQTVVAMTLGTRTESIFHDDSYGCRPKRSALDAVEQCLKHVDDVGGVVPSV